jgi:pimeloyl-ACP methyl ester carboxylesterase
MRVTTDDGVGLEVRVRGRGPGLVLVHGFGGAKEDFADHVDVLAERACVVTFDHRGHGESDAPTDPWAYSLDRLALDVVAVAAACGFESFRLLGHSMGGMVARRLVLSRPELIEALVLMDTSSGPVHGLDVDLLDAAADYALSDGKDALKELLDSAGALETPAYHRTLEQRPGYQEFQEAKWAALSVVMWATLAKEIAHQPDDLARLAGVQRPTLVLVGDQDRPFVADSRAMAEAIPCADLVVIPDAGHSPQFENPDAWAQALTGFLDQLAEPASASERADA